MFRKITAVILLFSFIVSLPVCYGSGFQTIPNSKPAKQHEPIHDSDYWRSIDPAEYNYYTLDPAQVDTLQNDYPERDPIPAVVIYMAGHGLVGAASGVIGYLILNYPDYDAQGILIAAGTGFIAGAISGGVAFAGIIGGAAGQLLNEIVSNEAFQALLSREIEGILEDFTQWVANLEFWDIFNPGLITGRLEDNRESLEELVENALDEEGYFGEYGDEEIEDEIQISLTNGRAWIYGDEAVFRVTYTDPTGNPPEDVRCVVEDEEYLMDGIYGWNISGRRFETEPVSLEDGRYEYYFIAVGDNEEVIETDPEVLIIDQDAQLGEINITVSPDEFVYQPGEEGFICVTLTDENDDPIEGAEVILEIKNINQFNQIIDDYPVECQELDHGDYLFDDFTAPSPDERTAYWVDVIAYNEGFNPGEGRGGFVVDVEGEVNDFEEHIIAENFVEAWDVYSCDIDNDDDTDILGAASRGGQIMLWENDGVENFDEHIITDNFVRAVAVHPVDLDEDGDVDIIGADFEADDVKWWENDGNLNFREHGIDDRFNGARSIFPVDLDDDGDIDLLGAADIDDDIVWWENDGDENFAKHVIDGNFDCARCVHAEDVDSDGDVDVLGAASRAGDIAWYENNGQEGFQKHIINANFPGAYSVYGVDLDEDGDIDVLGTGPNPGNNQVAWWENDGNEQFAEHSISRNLDGPVDVFPVDIDSDGDLDLLSAAVRSHEIALYENNGNENFQETIITNTFQGAMSVHADDVDSDGDIDILGACNIDNKLAWWENNLRQHHHNQQPTISIEPEMLDFGDVQVGVPRELVLSIRNMGQRELIISDISIDNGGEEQGFTVDFDGEIRLGLRQRTAVRVTLQPNEEGEADTDLIIESNDPDNEVLHVQLSGIGIEDDENILTVPDEFETIQEAIDAADHGQIVLVADGVYRGQGNKNISFQGKQITVRSVNGPDDCVIDCQEDGNGFNFLNNEGQNSILDGFTIRNGRVDRGTIHIGAAHSPQIMNCIIENCINPEEEYGSAIYFGNGRDYSRTPAIINNCIFRNCEGGEAPVRIVRSIAFVEDCLFENNSGLLSGGVSTSHGDRIVPTGHISNCHFVGNHGSSAGAIIMCHGYIADHCLIENNTSDIGASVVGGTQWSGSTSLINCTLFNNTVENRNINPAGDWHLTIKNCIIWGVDADQQILTHGNNYHISYTDAQNGPWEGQGIIDQNPLFVNAENGNFHLTANSPCIDAGDPGSPRDPNGTRADMGAYYYNGENGGEPELRDLFVELIPGWNMISINVSPDEELWERDEGPDVIRMLDQLRINEDNHHVELFKNGAGQFYVPAWGFNNIPYWNLLDGYQIKVDEDVEATWSGVPIPPDTDIPLVEGWNMVSYLPTFELDASAPDFYVLSQIIDHVLIAKDGDGLFLLPEWNFSSMEPWCETQGYQIKTDQEIVLNYPEEQDEDEINIAQISVEKSANHWSAIAKSDANMSLLVNSLLGQASLPAKHFEIGAFSSDGLLVGSGVAGVPACPTGDKTRCGIAVWGDDPTTDEKDGLKDGEAFRLKLWNSDLEKEFDLDVAEVLAGEGLTYKAGEFTVIDAVVKAAVPGECFLAQSYPNPFNSVACLTYGLPQAGEVSLRIYDCSGRLVETLFDGVQDAGYHNAVWNGQDLAAGLYLIRLETKKGSLVNKAILIK